MATRRKTQRRGHIFQRGKRWILTYRVNGKQAWESFTTKEQAELRLAEVSPLLVRGEMQLPERVTFETAADAWHANGVTVRGWKPKTAGDNRSMLNKWLIKEFGDLQLEKVTAERITRWRRERMATTDKTGKMSARTADKLVATLHAIFEFAQREYHVRHNPVADVERMTVRYDPDDIDFYEVEEVYALVRAADSKQDGIIYMTAAFSGLRRQEVLGLRWRNVDFSRQAIRVQRQVSSVTGEDATTKGGRVRSLPLQPELAKALAELQKRESFTDDGDYVFVNDEGRPVDGSALRRRYVKAQAKAKLRRIRFHDLRHTFGTIAVNAVLSPRELQSWMGHADARTTSKYLHYRERGDEAARLAKAFAPLELQRVSDAEVPVEEAVDGGS